jgi:hypothetical protein
LRSLIKITISILFCSYIFISCDTTDCITFSTRVVVIDFLDSATNTSKNVDFELITAIESPVLFYGDTTISRCFLPVNTEKEETTFLFVNPDSSIDTLQIGYDKTIRLISQDCGFEFQFKNILILKTTYDNAISLENELSRLNEENIKIFL